MKEKPFKTEVDLCAAFIKAVEKDGLWTCLAEWAGWDILMVRKSDGFQIGIEAKLRLNTDVVNQAINSDTHWHLSSNGPDCRAVLVPDSEPNGLDTICKYIGITVIRMRGNYPKNVWGPAYTPDLPTIKKSWREEWHEWCPAQRHSLPEYIPDVAAGSSAPVQLTRWKIAAMKIAITLEQRGYVTRADFKAHSIDHRRWLSPTGWLKVEGSRYVRGDMPDFKAQHPRVYEEIAADAEKWMIKAQALPEQTKMDLNSPAISTPAGGH